MEKLETQSIFEVPVYDYLQIVSYEQAVAAGGTESQNVILDAQYGKCVGVQVISDKAIDPGCQMSIFSQTTNRNLLDLVPVNIFQKDLPSRFSPLSGVIKTPDTPASGKQMVVNMFNGSASPATFYITVAFYLKKQ